MAVLFIGVIRCDDECRFCGQSLNIRFYPDPFDAKDPYVTRWFILSWNLRSKKWWWQPCEWAGPSRSFSFRRKQLEWVVEYGNGLSASGIVDFDNVGIGDVTLSLQSVQRAKISREDNFIEDSADDIPGLAFRNLNSVLPNSVKTPLELMIEQGNLKDRFVHSQLRPWMFLYIWVQQWSNPWRSGHSLGGGQLTTVFWVFATQYAQVGLSVEVAQRAERVRMNVGIS